MDYRRGEIGRKRSWYRKEEVARVDYHRAVSFEARVARVLIASPSDTAEARAVLRETIFDWNGVNGEAARLLFWPLMWERDAVPELGHPPQSILNRQLVDRSDVVLATFWTRLGTPTDEAASGTAEEIDRAVRAGKHVLVYFSSQPVLADSIDTGEYERLKEFRELLRTRGLFDGYASLDELGRKVAAALSRVAREKFATQVAIGADVGGPRAALVARVDREREPRVDGRGQGAVLDQLEAHHREPRVGKRRGLDVRDWPCGRR
jgi:hypothetical protein